MTAGARPKVAATPAAGAGDSTHSWWQRPRAREKLVLAALPLFTLIVFLVYPSRQYHWDTLERAYLLEHPGRFMHTWDGTPRSLFLSFAHVLELPLAAALRAILPGASGLQALVVLEAIAAAATLYLLGLVVSFWRRQIAPESRSDSWRAALVAQALLATALAFWKLGSSGGERVLALGTQLGFLLAFWVALAGGQTGAEPARWRARVTGSTLALAILSHLSGAVLVPFAVGALLLLPPQWRPQRRRVALGVASGVLLAGLAYVLVAATTANVRSPQGFVEYMTFFHRAGGNSFWEPNGAPAISSAATAGNRWVRIWTGLGTFFSDTPWAAVTVYVALLAIGVIPAVAEFRRRRGGESKATGAARPAEPARRGAPGLEPTHHGAAQRTLLVHALLLAALWSAHFAFFEPQNFESWTLVGALLVLVASVSLPAGRIAWGALALPVLLLVANARHYAGAHRPMEIEAFRTAVARATQPGDIVVLVGGLQNQKALRGSLYMRYFLATLHDRTLISLYDVFGVTEPEFWGRPYDSPAALQAALDSGRRAYIPVFLRPDILQANSSGKVEITTEARGDSLLEIKRIAAGGVVPR